MSVQSRSLGVPALTREKVNRGGAIIVWLVGAAATASFMSQLGVPDPLHILVGFSLQFLLTKVEAPLWQGTQRAARCFVALVIDVIFNAAGMWPYLKNLGDTQVWKMLSEWTNTTDAPNIVVLIIVVLSLSTLVAAGAEWLWDQEE